MSGAVGSLRGGLFARRRRGKGRRNASSRTKASHPIEYSLLLTATMNTISSIAASGVL